MGNEILSKLRKYTIDSELKMEEFKEMIEIMFGIRKVGKNRSRSRIGISATLKSSNTNIGSKTTMTVGETTSFKDATTISK